MGDSTRCKAASQGTKRQETAFSWKESKNERTEKKVEKIKHERKTTKMLRTGERPSEWTTKFRHTKGLGEHLLGSLFGYSKTEGRLMMSVGIKLLVAFE